MKHNYARRGLREHRPSPRLHWRERGDEVLPDMLGPYGGVTPGAKRCLAVGLERGDCPHIRTFTSSYCYYHEKLQRGLTEPTADAYPVWPLPPLGYVVTEGVVAA